MSERVGLAWPRGFVATDQDRSALLALMADPGLTPRRLLELSVTHRRAARCLAALRDAHGSARSRRRPRGATSKGPPDPSTGRSSVIDVERVRSELDRAGGRFVAVGDAEYPPDLLELFDPPAGLFVKGGQVGSMRPRVAIVGARSCSPSGAEIAKALGAAVARAGGWVVSGGARGIDGAAHQGALSAGGRTIAVLGTGIDLAYPPEHTALLAEVAARGAVVTEYPPGTHAQPYHFPARNRIVAALSCAVVVVEGATGSGSLITADHALDVGREIYAVPGAVTSALADVPLSLIREGATMIRDSDDLLFDLRKHFPSTTSDDTERESIEEPSQEATGPPSRSRRRRRPSSSRPRPTLAGNEVGVWDSLTAPSDLDRLAAATGLPLGIVAGVLVGLEIRGLVRRVGGRFERTLPEGR